MFRQEDYESKNSPCFRKTNEAGSPMAQMEPTFASKQHHSIALGSSRAPHSLTKHLGMTQGWQVKLLSSAFKIQEITQSQDLWVKALPLRVSGSIGQKASRNTWDQVAQVIAWNPKGEVRVEDKDKEKISQVLYAKEHECPCQGGQPQLHAGKPSPWRRHS